MAGPLRSMTGYGRGVASPNGSALTAEVRCVNSRHLDLRVRLPRDLQAFEAEIRELATPFFQRGQVELIVRVPAGGAAAPQVEIDLPAATRYAEAARQLQSELGLGEALSVSTLLALPGVARLREPALDADATRTALRAAAEQACRAALEMRTREGDALASELAGRLGSFAAVVGEIEALADEVRQSLRERLAKRLAMLEPELEFAPGRLEQEVVIYVDRMDVTEECVRLRSHAAQFHETLAESGPVGRKLEFLIQEMTREVNTIGSKSSAVPITRCVVDLKAEL